MKLALIQGGKKKEKKSPSFFQKEEVSEDEYLAQAAATVQKIGDSFKALLDEGVVKFHD